MAKLAVIGDKTSVLGFKSLGLDIYPVHEEKEAKESWSMIQRQDYAAVFITENAYSMIKELVLQITDQLTPAVLIIPGASGMRGLGLDRIKKIIETAIGVDILSSKERK